MRDLSMFEFLRLIAPEDLEKADEWQKQLLKELEALEEAKRVSPEIMRLRMTL